jgi:DNA-binding MarR family transcriptional regulator
VTALSSETTAFFTRLHKIDRAGLKVRDTFVLWSVARQPGMMGQEIAHKLGYPSRSSIQGGIERLLLLGFVEDRRAAKNQMTPNDLYILPAGEAFLADLLPQ